MRVSYSSLPVSESFEGAEVLSRQETYVRVIARRLYLEVHVLMVPVDIEHALEPNGESTTLQSP